MTKQERFAEALRRLGHLEISSNSGKYRAFRSPRGTMYFLGKSGAVRFGKNVSSSLALPESTKAGLLAQAGI